MRRASLAAAIIAASFTVAAYPAFAQGAAPGTGKPGLQESATEKPARRARSARTTREPTASQMAARERQRKCGAEWKEAKAASRTGGLKWPQFWSRCNTRLKGNQV